MQASLTKIDHRSARYNNELLSREPINEALKIIAKVFVRHEMQVKVIVRRTNSVFISLGVGDMLVINLYHSICAYVAERHTISHSRLVMPGNKTQAFESMTLQSGSLSDMVVFEATIRAMKNSLKAHNSTMNN